MLEDGTEVVLNRVRAPDGSYPVEYGEVVGPDGSTRHLSGDAFSIETTGSLDEPGDRHDVAGRLDREHPGRAARD